MAKGLMIMLVVFLVVGILGWIMNKFGNAPEEKKKKYRKVFLGLYGLLWIGQGIFSMNESNDFDWIATAYLVLGLVLLIIAFYGKLRDPVNSTS
ncbi:MAG: hypothetical protein HKO11_01975 [Eudoraea sp.]|nr:hypothetical protein [Eudoraea sp.]